MRRIALVAVMALVLSACWEQSGFDAGKSGFSPMPVSVNPNNVGTLARAFTAPPAQGSSALSGVQAVVSGGHLFVTGDRLRAFDASGASGCAGPRPSTCVPQWTSIDSGADFHEIVVGGGRVWTTRAGKLLGYDPAGVAGCSGTPVLCSPVITITPPTPASGGLRWVASLIHVAGTTGTLSSGYQLAHYAYDGNGAFKWQADLGTTSIPTVTERASVGDGNVLFTNHWGGPTLAFDARGITGCSGTPNTCVQMWSYHSDGLGVARNGRVYASLNGHIGAYDAQGVAGCAGTPKVCEPLWTTTGPSGRATITGDHLYVESDVYSLGSAGCSGSPLVCSPLWTNATTPTGASVLGGSVAGGVLYRPVLNCTVDPCSSRTIWQVDAHDAAGTVGCSGAPKVCNSLWTASFPFRVGEVLVVGDVVYAVGVSADFNGPSPEVWAFRAS